MRYYAAVCILLLRPSGPHIVVLSSVLYLYFMHTSTSVIIVRQFF